MSKIVGWEPQLDGSFEWKSDGHKYARVFPSGERWRGTWYYRGLVEGVGGVTSSLPDDFASAREACLAIEKIWVGRSSGWFLSAAGDYFRNFGKIVYVRKSDAGWYAARANGRVLGKDGTTSWFATAEQAMAAVEQERYTPADADPFRDKSNDWRWIKVKELVRAA